MSAEEAWLEYRDSYSLRRGTNARRTARQLRKREFVAGYEAALAAAEASCGGCGCADRLRAEARARFVNVQPNCYDMAADFLDAAPDARGSDLSAEQPATVSEQGHAKKRAEWNDPKEATDG